jgi:hypothetical protein
MNDTLTQTLVDHDLTETLGLSDMSDSERTEYLTELGGVIIERALLDFVSLLSEDEQEVFRSYVESTASEDDLVDRLQVQYPDFLDVLRATVLQFKADVIAVAQADAASGAE